MALMNDSHWRCIFLSKLSFSLSLSLSHSLSLPLFLSLSLSLSLSRFLSLALSLSLLLSVFPSRTLSPSFSLSLSLSLFLSLFLSLSISLCPLPFISITLSLTHTRNLFPPLSLFLSPSLSRTLTFSHPLSLLFSFPLYISLCLSVTLSLALDLKSLRVGGGAIPRASSYALSKLCTRFNETSSTPPEKKHATPTPPRLVRTPTEELNGAPSRERFANHKGCSFFAPETIPRQSSRSLLHGLARGVERHPPRVRA